MWRVSCFCEVEDFVCSSTNISVLYGDTSRPIERDRSVKRDRCIERLSLTDQQSWQCSLVCDITQVTHVIPLSLKFLFHCFQLTKLYLLFHSLVICWYVSCMKTTLYEAYKLCSYFCDHFIQHHIIAFHFALDSGHVEIAVSRW